MGDSGSGIWTSLAACPGTLGSWVPSGAGGAGVACSGLTHCAAVSALQPLLCLLMVLESGLGLAGWSSSKDLAIGDLGGRVS